MSFEADVEAEGKTRTSATRMARSRSEQRYASSGKEADDEAADAGMAADSPASTGVKQRVTTRHRSRRSATGDYAEEDDEIEVVRESKGEQCCRVLVWECVVAITHLLCFVFVCRSAFLFMAIQSVEV